MRLLHTTQLTLHEFADAHVPRGDYAVLSHRWGAREVSMSALMARRAAAVSASRASEGSITEQHPDRRALLHRDHMEEHGEALDFAKIAGACRLARSRGLEWIWIDTCCIDRKSSSELSEAINSMFRWYAEARECYAYLVDVEPGSSSGGISGRKMEKSSHMCRGWTLQELLAPTWMAFYDAEWNMIGTRGQLAENLSRATGIDVCYLRGKESEDGEREHFQQASIAKRMSWLSRRQTTRVEDMAYCMLGIFDVNMPLMYGEGEKAFLRLQLEIIKKSDDESIFAWKHQPRPQRPLSYQKSTFKNMEMPYTGMLALSPVEFVESADVWIDPLGWRCEERLPYSMTNKGLEFRTLVDWWASDDDREGTLIDIGLNCWQGEPADPQSITISLQKIGKVWTRVEADQMKGREHVHSSVRRSGSMPFGAAPKTVTVYVKQGGM